MTSHVLLTWLKLVTHTWPSMLCSCLPLILLLWGPWRHTEAGGGGAVGPNIPARGACSRQLVRGTPGGEGDLQQRSTRNTELVRCHQHVGASRAVCGAAVRAVPGGQDGSREGGERSPGPPVQLQQAGGSHWSVIDTWIDTGFQSMLEDSVFCFLALLNCLYHINDIHLLY